MKNIVLSIRTVEELDKIVKRNEKVRNEFKNKNINTVDFAKKLLGQIVFLYFLQKKGWFGVRRDAEWGTGPKDFLRRLFNKEYGDYKNFFNDVLEPLFYEALARERDDDFYSRFNCKIPFLNGGLFDPVGGYDWIHVDINLPNDLFSNKKKTKEGDTGDGILDVFDRFNFTVKEDEPLDKEVAVDPELLGKLYEKFNAITSDNFYEYKNALASGKKSLVKQFNKKFGVYYTPREIVHYMCQQSLIYYLEHEFQGKVSEEDIEKLIKYGEQFAENEATVEEKGRETKTYKFKLPESIRKNAKLIDEKLKEIKVCDPAAGSGAFLVGMMHEITKARNVLSVFINEDGRTNYNFKRECIENSLYGVDIDPGAVEIAKLRLWLSLIVDEEDIRNIKPLPNLDYKIMQGNSLIEKYEGIKLIDDRFFKKDVSYKNSLKDEQLKLQREYINLHNQNRLTREKKEEIEKRLKDIEKTLKKLDSDKKDDKRPELFAMSKAKKKAEELLELQKRFRSTFHKPKKDKLREKIESLTWDLIEATLKEQGKEDKLKEIIQFKKANIRPFFLWHLHFAEVFQNKGGFDIVIANPPYVRQERIKDQKNLLSKAGYEVYNSTSDLYTYFYERSWKILKPNGFSCFISSNKWMRAKYGEKLRKFFKDKTEVINLIDFGGYPVFEATVDTNIILFKKKGPEKLHKVKFVNVINKPDDKELIQFVAENQKTILQEKLNDNCWTLADEKILRLKEKIERVGTPLKDWDVKIYFGIKTGFNKAFIIDNQTKERLCREDPKSAEILKPILRGRDIGRYYYRWAGLWVIKIESGWTNKNRGRIKPEEFFKNKYPAIYKHLISFKNFKGKGKGLINRDDQGDYWWELRDCDYYFEFEKEKIVWQRVTQTRKFSLVPAGIYAEATTHFITSSNINLKYILGVLNSYFFEWSFYRFYQGGGIEGEIKGEFIKRFPVPKIPEAEQKPFIDLVNKILSITKDDDYLDDPQKQAKVKEYECRIDQMVYKLYGLSDEEVKIIEKSKSHI